ncbi:hypothetical protein Dimus_002295 [Dionaea muscipula]
MDRISRGAVAVLVVGLVVVVFGSCALGLSQTQPPPQPLPLTSFSERLALIRLRSSLGLRAKEWPIKADPCLNWTGIECRNGTVVGINISGFRRTRIGSKNPQFAVDALANLTRLESFNASFFLLPGQIPDLFGQELGGLQVLDLHSCSIVGAIPSSLGNLSSLTTLILSDNKLAGTIPPSFGQLLLNLSVLDLSQNNLTGSIPASLGSLRKLAVLGISSNYLSGSIPPGILGNLTNLQSLNLSGNSLTSSIPAELGKLTSLLVLDLSSNNLQGSLPLDLKGLRNLQQMAIGNNGLVGVLPDGLFTALTRLELVDFKGNNFSGAIPDALWSLSSLRFVDLSANNLTGTLPQTTNASGAAPAALNLSNNRYYGELTSVLQRFTTSSSSSSLDLSNNFFEGKVPDYYYAQSNASSSSLSGNCLQNVTRQRTLAQCASFYTLNGLKFDNFGLPSSTVPALSKKKKSSHKRTIILAAVLGGVAALVLLFLLLLLLLLCRRGGLRNQRGRNGVGPIPATATMPPSPPGVGVGVGVAVNVNVLSLGEAFTYQQLLQATGDFSEANLIKHGHSGDLFRGILDGGIPVVVKRIDLNAVKKELSNVELEFFSKVSHPRLVPLVGHCLENENLKCLVYKFMPNGDLSSSLYRRKVKVNPDDDDSLQSLDWITRLKIAIGAAEGLSYLHERSPPYVHRDVQASSILLDDKFEVRLGSLSEVYAQEGDIPQSVISRFLRLPQTSDPGPSGLQTATCAYDIYCFGKVLLGLVTGKLGISGASSSSSDVNVKEWLDQTLPYISLYDKDLITKILDPSLIVDEDLLEEVWAMAIVARSCLQSKPSKRPPMRYILRALENPLKVVREDNSGGGGGSARLRTTSSRGSWIFGSWRHSSSDAATIGPTTSMAMARVEGTSSSLKREREREREREGTSSSQGSGRNNGSSSLRRQSREIFPEPNIAIAIGQGLGVETRERERQVE